ncbi:unnamed protein product, partial [Scytosiphon promiscuus]
WLASEAGPLRLRIAGQEAVCFFPTAQQSQLEAILATTNGWRIAPTQLKNFTGEPVSALYFKSRRKLLDVRDGLLAQEVRVTEADLKPTDRFLMERFITAAVEVEGDPRPSEGFSDIDLSAIRSIEYRPKLRAVSIDIETDYQASTLYSIAIFSPEISIVYMVGQASQQQLDAGDGEGIDFYLMNSER